MRAIRNIPTRSRAGALGVSVLAVLLSIAVAPVNALADGSGKGRANNNSNAKGKGKPESAGDQNNGNGKGNGSENNNASGNGNGNNNGNENDQGESKSNKHGGANVIHVPGNFATIQAAINAASAGDTIVVQAGTYSEAQIVIDKAVSVLGEDEKGTIIDGGNSTGLSSAGLVRIIANGGNVVFSGFTLQNAGHFQGNRVGIFANSFDPTTTFLITHVRIIGSNNPTDVGDYGLYAIQGFETLLFVENEVTQTGSNPVIIEQHVGATDISGNRLDVGVFGSDAIFTFTHGGVDVDTLQRRNDNTIDVGTGGPFDAPHRATGITFAGAFRPAPYTTDLGGGHFTQVEIKGNMIGRIQAERRGISLWDGAAGDGSAGDIPGAMVQKNELTGVGAAAVGSKGIQLLGRVTDIKLINNDLSDLETGIHLRDWLSGGPDGTKIIANRFDNVTTPLSSDPEAVDTKYHGAHVSP